MKKTKVNEMSILASILLINLLMFQFSFPASSNANRSGLTSDPNAVYKIVSNNLIFVDVNNLSGIEDGTRDHPYNKIQEGISHASSGDTILIAAGVYFERINLRGGVKLLGVGANQTIIDGTNRNYPVVTANNTSPGTSLEGLTIRNGNGKQIGGYTYGAGVYSTNSTIAFKNCAFVDNHATDGAGGVEALNSNISIDRCDFINNHGWWGGALTIKGGSLLLQNSFIDQSTRGYGGTLYIAEGAHLTSINNVITRSTGFYASVIGVEASTAEILNNTIVDNLGYGVWVGRETNEGSAVIRNSIFWGNTDDLFEVTATYSNIQNSAPGEGNISVNPQFVNPGEQDYHLKTSSPCIDTGTDIDAPEIDFDGDARPTDGNHDGTSRVDIGADEYSPLKVSITSGANTSPGSLTSYRMRIENLGETRISHVELTNVVPEVLTLIEDSITASKDNVSYMSGVLSWRGSLNSGEEVRLNYKSIVNPLSSYGTSIVNSVSVQAEGIQTTANVTVLVDYYHSYVGFVSKPYFGIHGTVSQNGSSANGVPLVLRFYDGGEWSTIATTNTNSDGFFQFINIPELAEGQSYYVLYQNTQGTPDRLWVWATRELTSYIANSSVEIGKFDIADIELISPGNGAQIYLPYNFRWSTRTASPTDSYEFNLFDPRDNEPYFYTDPPLGYVGVCSLNGLPEGFRRNDPYVWDIWVYSPDGGVGISYEARWVVFANIGLNPGYPTIDEFENILPQTSDNFHK